MSHLPHCRSLDVRPVRVGPVLGHPLCVGEGMSVIKFVILEGVVMSEETRKRLVIAILSRLLETATGMKLLWIDMGNGRAMFQFSPTDEQVAKFLQAVPVAISG